MTALDSLRNADLQQALADLQNEVRREPNVAKHRVFLFQLLAVLGQWDRALTQLNVARELDPKALEMAQAYQEILHCEVLRAQVFAGQRTPIFFGEPEPWLAQIWEAQVLTGKGQHAAAQQLRDQAYESAPVTSGRIWKRQPGAPAAKPDLETDPGIEFEWIADADSRLGPILEMIVNGRYYWAPLHRIRRIEFEAPTDLRDLVWAPAQFEWANGGESVGMIPVRYAGSEASSDNLIRLGRKTEWTEAAPGVFLGAGQRLLTTEQDEYALLEVARLVLGT